MFLIFLFLKHSMYIYFVPILHFVFLKNSIFNDFLCIFAYFAQIFPEDQNFSNSLCPKEVNFVSRNCPNFANLFKFLHFRTNFWLLSCISYVCTNLIFYSRNFHQFRVIFHVSLVISKYFWAKASNFCKLKMSRLYQVHDFSHLNWVTLYQPPSKKNSVPTSSWYSESTHSIRSEISSELRKVMVEAQ